MEALIRLEERDTILEYLAKDLKNRSIPCTSKELFEKLQKNKPVGLSDSWRSPMMIAHILGRHGKSYNIYHLKKDNKTYYCYSDVPLKTDWSTKKVTTDNTKRIIALIQAKFNLKKVDIARKIGISLHELVLIETSVNEFTDNVKKKIQENYQLDSIEKQILWGA